MIVSGILFQDRFPVKIKLFQECTAIALDYIGIEKTREKINDLLGYILSKPSQFTPFGAVIYTMLEDWYDQGIENVHCRVFQPILETVSPDRGADIFPDGMTIMDLPTQKVLSVFCRGWKDVSDIGKMHDFLNEIIQQSGYKAAGRFMELYWNDPELVPPEDSLVELQYPIE